MRVLPIALFAVAVHAANICLPSYTCTGKDCLVESPVKCEPDDLRCIIEEIMKPAPVAPAPVNPDPTPTPDVPPGLVDEIDGTPDNGN